MADAILTQVITSREPRIVENDGAGALSHGESFTGNDQAGVRAVQDGRRRRRR